MMIFAPLLSLALAAEIDVSPGDDLASLTESLGPDSEIVLSSGTYEIEGDLRWSAIGTEDQPIVIRAAEPGNAIIKHVDGGWSAHIQDAEWIEVEGLVFENDADSFTEQDGNGIYIANSSHITIKDCEVRYVDGTGIRVDGNNSQITLEGNHIHDTSDGSGIAIGCWDASCWTEDSVVIENWIHDFNPEDGDNGIYLLQGSQGITVRDNVIYRTYYRGIHTDSTEYGPQNIIEANAVWEVADTGIRVEGSALVRNNVVFNVDGYGIRSNNNSRDALENVQITFNTVANTTDFGIRVGDWWDKPSMVLANNAVSNVTGLGFDYSDDDDIEDAGGTTDNYISTNIVSGYVEGIPDEGDPDPPWVIPGQGLADFSDVDNWDFYPAQGSSLINAADPAGDAYVPAEDFNGAPRQGDVPDVGAYEWSSSDNPGWTVQEDFKELGYSGGDDYNLGGGCCKKKQQNGSEAILLLPLLGFSLLRRRRED